VVDGGELVDHDRLGAWLDYIARMRLYRNSHSSSPFDIARGAGEDIVSVSHLAEGDRVVVSWRQRARDLVEWDAEASLQRWMTAFANSPDGRVGLRAWREEDDVLLLASDAELDPGLATGEVAWTMVPQDEPEPPMNAAAALVDMRRGCGHVAPLAVPLHDE
jgi:hypothetical protein